MNISPDMLTGLLSSLSVILGALSIHFRASSRAQRATLSRLREKDIEWALYVHDLREFIARESGKRPPDYLKSLVWQDVED